MCISKRKIVQFEVLFPCELINPKSYKMKLTPHCMISRTEMSLPVYYTHKGLIQNMIIGQEHSIF